MRKTQMHNHTNVQTRITTIQKLIKNLWVPHFTNTMKLSKFFSSIVSAKFVFQNTIDLKTRYLYFATKEMISWDSKI